MNLFSAISCLLAQAVAQRTATIKLILLKYAAKKIQ